MSIRRFARRVRAHIKPRRPRPAILMYHRVLSCTHDIWDLCVSPEIFNRQMAYLRSHRSPMPMHELVQRLREKTLPADAVAVTFDDGYLDNLVNAKPILMRHKVPATVFVATGFTNSTSPFWWDELAGMILSATGTLELPLEIQGEAVLLSLGEREPADAEPAWRGWDPPRTRRQLGYFAIWSRLQSASPAERERVMGILRQHLHAPADPLGVPMTEAQLGELVQGGLVCIGGHTVHHQALTDLERTASRLEIEESAQQCRGWTPEPVHGFAYPFGNFGPEVCEDAAASSFSWACTTEGEFLDASEWDLFALPRLTATNMSPRRFAHLLSSS